MKLLADQNFPYASVKVLKGAGFNTKHAEKELSGITDKEFIQLAIEEDRAILTFDGDFAKLSARYGNLLRAGIIVLNITGFNDIFPGQLLVKLFKATDIKFRKRYTIVSDDFIRQRKYI